VGREIKEYNNKAMLPLVDTHAHLDMPNYDFDRPEVIKRANQSGVTNIITMGIDLESSQKAIELAEKYSSIWAAVGFHPEDIGNITEVDIETLTKMAQHPGVVAIGEIGLDYYHRENSQELQIRIFKWQLELAKN